jgi:hypothetical protein
VDDVVSQQPIFILRRAMIYFNAGNIAVVAYLFLSTETPSSFIVVENDDHETPHFFLCKEVGLLMPRC